jgi:hypothetical protein
MNQLIDKLNPARFPNMSPKMGAIVGFVLDKKFTTPRIVEMTTTPENYVLARVENDCGFNCCIGSMNDLVDNWQSLLKCADLTSEEKNQADFLFTHKLLHVGN